ncbi:MAG: HAD-IA family hydrolase [Pseudonocardiaceae bacterium]
MHPEAGSGTLTSLRIRAEAALFDLDGVLVDSMPIIREIFEDWARSRGLDSAHVVQTVHGRPTMEALADLVPATEVAGHLAYLTAEEIRRSAEMACLPGAKELLTGLPAGRWTVVTSGAGAVARARLASTGLPWPQVLVTADDVERGKPAPDCYLLAAARLGILPAGCVVVEDAPAGVRAALAAGMRCIGIGGRLAGLLPETTVNSPAEIRLEL